MRIDQRDRLLRKELRKLLPVDKDDVAALEAITAQLFLIATDGQSWGADLLALRLLAQHRIGDPQWITGWLEFKREHHVKRLSEIAEILRILPG